jgi:hypothetical protein
MATTTNYSWSTPDDTALVKDGAAAIRSLGTAIDTTVFTNAGAAIAKTIVDAKGDLIAGTAADTVARLAYSGTNGDLLTVDTTTATGLKWVTPTASATQMAIFRDEKTTGTHGGTFTLGAWRTRDINATQVNQITGSSIASNQITLPAGTFYIAAVAPCVNVEKNQARFYNITDSAVAILGQNSYTEPGSVVSVGAIVEGVIVLTSSKVFELQHQSSQTGTTYGFGVNNSFGNTLVYANVTITKVG